ncbi:hypothetical protein L218DRAFT_748252 [Marasmius fiardii PR-910]|nr:hypothetical protein L218DRAFT_748252 [Marasmius fiardii PR-910]
MFPLLCPNVNVDELASPPSAKAPLSRPHRMLVPRASSPSAEGLRIRDKVVDAIAYSSIISCIVVIITAVLLSRHPLSKPKTDRVSFRIMIYALCASVVYSIAAILANRASGPTVCRVAASFVIVGLHLSSFLLFFIGLNLQLVMIHGVDGTRAEKYYVWVSLSLAIALGILTYASNQLVYNPTQSVCYYYDPNPIRGLLWRIGTQLLWSYLTMAGEIITFVSVVVYMVRVKVLKDSQPRVSTASLWVLGSTGTLSCVLHYIPYHRYLRRE